jgi:dUTP pyrophosphatase
MRIDILLDKGAKMPTKAHPDTDAGFDLYTPYEFTVKAGGSAVVQTGVHMVIPKKFCGVVISKSGLLTKQDITTTGLVDAAYTGGIVIKVQNHGNRDYHFNKGDKVTQIMILPVPEVELVEIDNLPKTERGANGFGSTGK